ncbi:DUF3427 domain-containing protein [Pectinatus haikarae]|uniref:Superfamily II DNA or RNA helicase/HKD family nuclease n=1 Tax=Pectinatus haikarae TaxID=349096 RepID=A0ABT9Y8V8_9FIRM|nr:DUF3427 domain-containing protein [Pectinatus haikarae]MDQ0204277.1 superfamily II DNA or RNA helicase/HKD family nuclease [Pectinatus haikarae]
MKQISSDFTKALLTSFVDTDSPSKETLRSELVYNDFAQNRSIISSLEKLLKNCTSFDFVTAFITKSGLLLLKDCLSLLEKNKIKGRIITSDYLNFTDPSALAELRRFSNIKLKIYTENNLHTKGYIFYTKQEASIIIGSANITQEALKANEEWNTKLICTKNSELYKKITDRFALLWDRSEPITDQWLEEYKKYYNLLQASRKKFETAIFQKSPKIRANMMQKTVLASLLQLRQHGKDKALLISATGTGKTFLSALDIKSFNPRRVLFVAHREQILRQAEKSYKKILGNNISTGFLTGKQKDIHADFTFASISMLMKEHIIKLFSPIDFDYIIIDETHRAGADGYKHFLAYFKPAFLLGMTATPERTDDFDIYGLFDNNIAYEIRLQEAMRENMLCPFHYFGITDIQLNGKPVSDDISFSKLTCHERVNHIIKKASFYGCSGTRVKGLVFCRTREEAYALSCSFNEKGFHTLALSARDSQKTRSDAVKKLAQKDRMTGIDYIFSVDIMNEGIDIPEVNQIILLRPTQSPIIFVQQLGRGLRKCTEKDYVVILDFIGNYTNNFMIPIALFGDNSYNKDNLRRCINYGKNLLHGPSTVSFDPIARKNIYAAIDTARFNDTTLLRKAYDDLKNKLGKIPLLSDFSAFGTIDILKYMEKFGSYHFFLKKYEKKYTVNFSTEQEEILLFICKRFAHGKRIHEIEMLNLLLENTGILSAKFTERLRSKYGIKLTMNEKKSVIRNLTNMFTISNERNKYKHCVFIKSTGNNYIISDEFSYYLQDKIFKDKLKMLLHFAEARFEKYYTNNYKNTCLCLYRKYTYEEVCYLLNWPQKINPNAMAGYFYEKTTKTMPVFINYVNSDKKRVAYANKFTANNCINAYSKSNRKIDSTDASHVYDTTEGNHLYLFVRKSYDQKEGKEFYFLGEIKAAGGPIPAPQFNGFEVNYKLETPVRTDIFDYLTD